MVFVTSNGFDHDPVNIVAGEAVYWIDDGSGPYTIISLSGAWVSFETPGGILFDTPGTYSYADDNGDFGTIHVTANIPPSVNITSPSNNAVFTAPASFTFSATASDTDHDGLLDVEFYVDDNLVDDIFFAPFSTPVAGLPAGIHTLTAIAYDYAGASTTNSISVTVQGGAQISLAGAAVVGGKFRFIAVGLTIGKTNVLQSITNLTLTNWSAIATNVATNTLMTFSNITVSAGPHYFRLFQRP